jgi:hypothetical protein
MPKMNPTDARLMQLADTLKANGVFKSHKAFYEAIGFERRNVYNVRQGTQSFKAEHIQRACEVAGANANWIFGVESNMFRETVRPEHNPQLAAEERNAPNRKPKKSL